MLDTNYRISKSSQKAEGTGTINNTSATIKSCQTVEGLSQIQASSNELVIWNRSLPLKFKNWIEGVSHSNLPNLRILIDPCELKIALEPMLDACGLTDNDLRKFLVNDISGLVYKFSQITKTKLVDVRLEHIDHDACSRFHTDIIDLRLLTTYLGMGTEWVDPKYAQSAIQEQKKYSGPLERLKFNDVAIFKGKKASKTDGIVHRSPPIEHTGNSRLLLCLNKKTEVSPPPWNRN